MDEDFEAGPSDPEMGSIVPPLRASDIRYWSDFNRVYYLPRSIHKLPDLADWETADGDWQGGKETFSRYNSVSYTGTHRWHIVDVLGFYSLALQDNALMDDSFRLFVEECDTFQVPSSFGPGGQPVNVNHPSRDYNFAPTMSPLVPSSTRWSLPSVMSSQNSPP